MIRNKKIQSLANLATIIIFALICSIGAWLLKDIIYYLLVHESRVGDNHLLNSIVSFFNFYTYAHYLFIVLAVVGIAISIVIFLKDKTYKFAFFTVIILTLVLLIMVVNRNLISLMRQAKVATISKEVATIFANGKDFITVIMTLTQKGASVGTTILKSLALDIVALTLALLGLVASCVKALVKDTKQKSRKV